MKPNPNARNKRVSNLRQRKQHHVLEVKLRESKERVRRFRAVTGFIFKTILLVSMAGGIWYGGKEALRRFLWENPDYFVHLEDLRFRSDGTLTREQVIAASGRRLTWVIPGIVLISSTYGSSPAPRSTSTRE